MFVKPSDTVTVQFTTQTPTTGAAANADSLPTGVLVKNGDDTAETVTVTNVSTGVYKAAVTIPSSYAAGDEVQLRIAATVASVAGKAVVWGAEVDTARVSETYTRLGAPAGASIAADVANVDDLVLDTASGVETGMTVRQALRLIAAALGGELSGAAGTTITIRNAVADSKTRITATVDADGNRTAVTTDLT